MTNLNDKNYNFEKLSLKERKALPDTYGVPVNDIFSWNAHANRKLEKPVYDLDIESVKYEFQAALTNGLENYGSGIGGFIIPRILKASNNTNKIKAIWKLYISEVCGAKYSEYEINKAWHSYSKEDRKYLKEQLSEYLDSCLEYLQTYF